MLLAKLEKVVRNNVCHFINKALLLQWNYHGTFPNNVLVWCSNCAGGCFTIKFGEDLSRVFIYLPEIGERKWSLSESFSICDPIHMVKFNDKNIPCLWAQSLKLLSNQFEVSFTKLGSYLANFQNWHFRTAIWS